MSRLFIEGLSRRVITGFRYVTYRYAQEGDAVTSIKK